jgi:mannose-1-phosphate guanylyltransferase / mannose-6-phosphate isomerase
MYSIILCGGSGTRLWPLSRKNFPKQFLSLGGENSLLQETYLRMREVMPAENIYFVTNQDNFFNVYNQVKEIDKDFGREQVLIEPASLNTAPAITLAIKHLIERVGADLDAPVIILPSDHLIRNRAAYTALISEALKTVGDNIGTIGITPTKPETGYGYIRKGEGYGVYQPVLEFKEKPDLETARQYLASGEYVWNSGMYIFSSRAYLRELKEHAPELYDSLAKGYDDFVGNFKNLPSISIDYAISEKSERVVVYEGEFGWSDIGSFDSLAEMADELPKLKTRHLSVDSNNIFVHSAGDRLVATLGVEDLVVIDSNDSLLIYRSGQGEQVKKVVDRLKESDAKELEHQLVVHRPWGKYEVLVEDRGHKVKKITVYPQEKLSLQSHCHRAEHWIVVQGLAKVVNGDKEVMLRENESTFIPKSTIHRLENPGKINLELIEVQTGNYLEEDDIQRFDDIYSRIEK